MCARHAKRHQQVDSNFAGSTSRGKPPFSNDLWDTMLLISPHQHC